MERTRFSLKTNVSYPIDEEPIVLSKPLLDTFLSQPKPADLISLYCFYYYTANWQKTNQVKATTDYVAKGLVWGADRVRSSKKELIKLKLIEDIVARGKGNRVIGHYIKVNFIWKASTTKDTFHPKGFPESGNVHSMENHKANTLSTNNINALNTNKKKTSKNLLMELLPNKWKDNQPFQESLQSYLTHRKEKRQTLTPEACKRLAKKLSKYSISTVITALDNSVDNGWTGVFPESVNKNTNKSGSRRGSATRPEFVEYDEQL